MIQPVSPPGTATHPGAAAAPCESQVALRKDEVIRLLERHGALGRPDARRFHTVCRLIEAVFHHDFHLRQERLKSLYAPFDPDSLTRPVEPGRARGDITHEVLEQLELLLSDAHYYPLPPEELERALRGSTYWGLDLEIDRSIFDRLLIYARGARHASRVRRDLGTWFRQRRIELEVYDRLVVAVKLRPTRSPDEQSDTDNIYLKMFRDIPKLDIEMLLPGTRPRMRWFDTTRIGGSSLTGLFSLARYIRTPGATWLMIALGAFMYALQSIFGYRRTKAEYVHSLTQQLYYQNLDNNAGVFCRVIDEAEDETTKEAILTYYFLWRDPDGMRTPQRLRDEIEQLIRAQTGQVCRFQVSEAIARLVRLEVLMDGPAGLRALTPEEAVIRLSEQWARCLQRADD